MEALRAALSPSASSASSNDSRTSRHHHKHRKSHQRSGPTDQSMSSSSCRSSRNSDELSLASTCDDHPRVNLPVDREFLALDNPTPHDDHEQEQVRDQVICMIFDLPQSTQFYQDFSCAIASTLAMHGRMYPTSSHVCFYSNVFGRERKILIPYESIREVEKTTTMVFQHSIRLATFGKDEYTFTSFWGNNRDTCYDLIQKTRDRVLRELRPTAVNEAESRYPALSTIPDSASPVESSPLSQSNAAVKEDEETEDEAVGSDDEVAVVDANSDSHVITAEVDHEDQTIAAVPRRGRVVSDVDSIAPKDISMTQILEKSFPVSATTFMELFYVDNAPFGLDTFSEQTGSTEMTINPWMTPLEEEKSFGMTRSLQFRVPIEAPIGPKSSQVDVLQCLKESSHGVRVVESSTRLVDIPYGDYFSVEDRWTIVPDSSNPNACKIFIEIKVVFGKSTFWKNTIETRAISDNRTKWEKWVGMAQEFLDTRKFDDSVNNVTESPPTSNTLFEKTIQQNDIRQSRVSTARRRSRSKPSHRHRTSTAASMQSTVTQTGVVKVFPWVLVLLLLLVVLRLQMTLSSIERSVLMNTELISGLQQQLIGIQGACSVAT